MLTANHLTEHWDANGEVRGRTKGAEGVCNPLRTKISTNQIPQSSQGLNHQPKSIHGGTNGSSYICNREWHYLATMGRKALGPVKAPCPSIGECGEAGVSSRWRYIIEEAVGMGWRFAEGKPGKGITFEL